MQDTLSPPRFRVPREDRSFLSIPDLQTASAWVAENRKLFAQSSCVLHGRSLDSLRTAARKSAIRAAQVYTRSILNLDLPELSENTDHSCLVSGHQPELFHVGVWAKNFALAKLAEQTKSVGLNLVIDNDSLGSTSIRVPSGTASQIRIDRVQYDLPRPPLPWEEAQVLDPAQFQAFGADVAQRIRQSWGFEPLIGTAWPAAVQAMANSGRLCDGLTGFRAHVERSWGLGNLELPMSQLCETEPFHWFFAHLMMRLPEFHTIYNNAVGEYRRAHRLRNRMQPVPDLESADGWLEAPFWVWRGGESDRGRLFVRRIGSVCELRLRNEIFARLPYTEQGSLDDAVALLAALPLQGIRLRTRALTTTLFTRICLADLFLHGIGGAKYDTMTDRICERLFGIKAPSFLTVSATLYLPLGDLFATTEFQLRNIQHRLRDLNYNPDRHLGDSAAVAGLIAEKTQLLTEAQRLRDAKTLQGRLTTDQHRRLSAIRSSLQSHVQEIRQGYEAEQVRLKTELAANSLLRNREYPAALYPESLLKEFLMRQPG